MKDLIIEMEQYASLHNVPIIEKESITFIMKYIKANKIKNILEIGSAIGYSAILMASTAQDVTKCGFEQKINVVFQDALDVNLTDVSYDLIFIDAAKSQSIKFFEKFKYFLKDNGTIITDNLKFHGNVGKSSEIESKNLRSLVGKIENYIEFLKNNPEFETKFYNVGDGLSVSVKKDEKK